ncbi:MAG: hypothetical protein GXP19_09630 [Gammaproteobacteria bacterium]|nr:hypothetical protein [Gammaproteobacteria bacterium]
MSQEIISLLEYPRTLLREMLSVESCPHDLLYDKGDQKCRDCFDGAECEWLYKNDAIEELNKKTHEQLMHDLEFAILVVQAQITRLEHDDIHCECEACTWLQAAQKLYEERHQTPRHIKLQNLTNHEESTYNQFSE